MSERLDHSALVALLAWYRQMGVDAAVSAEAIDWTTIPDRRPGAEAISQLASIAEVARDTAQPEPPQPRPAQQPAPHAATAPPVAKPPAAAPAPPRRPTVAAKAPDAIIADAVSLARAATSLAALRQAIDGFEGCALKATAKNLCFARGADRAHLMVIGDAPGREEDLTGQPFAGPEGALLDKMLAAIGLDDTSVQFTNIVYWRPPGNRAPTPLEAQICRPFLERQVELAGAKMVLVLGQLAAQQFIGVPQSIMKLRGTWHDVDLDTVSSRVRVMACLHPSYLLKTPVAKRLAWRDLRALRAALPVE